MQNDVATKKDLEYVKNEILQNTQKDFQNFKNDILDKIVDKEQYQKDRAKLVTKEDLKKELSKYSTKDDLRSEINEIRKEMREIDKRHDQKYDKILEILDGIAGQINSNRIEKAAGETTFQRHEKKLDDHELRRAIRNGKSLSSRLLCFQFPKSIIILLNSVTSHQIFYA